MLSLFSELDLSSFINWLLTKALTCASQSSLYYSEFHFRPHTLVCIWGANTILTLVFFETIANTRFVMPRSRII